MLKRLLCVMTLVGCVACLPPPVTDVSAGSPLQADTLTVDGTDRYTLTGDHHLAVTAAPATNTGGNTRVAITTAWQAPTVDHGVCATWTAAATGSQPGLMLRWDGTHGISVTRNVWGGVGTVLNVHSWDLSTDSPFTILAQFPLTGLGWPGPTAPLPWRACAQTAGPLVHFKVWPLVLPEPAGEDPCCTGTVTVAFLGAGRPGWYVGHLPPGGTVVVTDLLTLP